MLAAAQLAATFTPAPTGLDRLFRKILCGADVDALAESILRDNWKLAVQ